VEPLLDRIRVALDAGATHPLEDLQALLKQTGGEKCWRRNRILHLLSHYLLVNSPLPMSHSTTHRFKAGFAHADFSGFPLIVGDKTKIVTAANLTDADVPLLQQYGGGHLIEELPKPEKAAKAPAEVAKTDEAEKPAPKKH
jgi:hypothetical protein